MAKKRTTLESVMKELKTIKKLVLSDLRVDIEEINLDKKYLKQNKKPIRESKKIFDDVVEWKIHIWDECPNKKIVSETKEFDYNCELLKSGCKFEHCPLNIRK